MDTDCLVGVFQKGVIMERQLRSFWVGVVRTFVGGRNMHGKEGWCYC